MKCVLIMFCFHLWVILPFSLIINSSRGPKIDSAIVIGLSTDFFFHSFFFKVQKVSVVMNEMQL